MIHELRMNPVGPPPTENQQQVPVERPPPSQEGFYGKGRLHEDDGRLREDDGKMTEDYFRKMTLTPNL